MGIETTTNSFDFVGNLEYTSTIHNGYESHTVTRDFEYDHANRLEKVYHTLNNGTRTLIVDNQYNEIGELINKKLHSEDEGATAESEPVSPSKMLSSFPPTTSPMFFLLPAMT